jgi:hypothetical protein
VSLQLASAKRRAHAFLEQVGELEKIDFPHLDGQRALADIKKQFEAKQSQVSQLPPYAPAQMVRALCQQIYLDTLQYTKLLGLILRSTNIRNAFEIQDPLTQLVRKAVHPEARLVLSSEWAYGPETYPMNVPGLPTTVFITNPAQESKYALYFAIAGHEVGHSVWRQHKVAASFQNRIADFMSVAISKAPELVPPDNARYFQDSALFNALRQLEEIFCDIFATIVFGEAYAYAFEYYLSSASHSRVLNYPPNKARSEYIQIAMIQLAICHNPKLSGGWAESTLPPNCDKNLFQITDSVVTGLAPSLISETIAMLAKIGISPPDATKVTEITNVFSQLRPYNKSATIAELLCAGWTYLQNEGGLGEGADEKRFDVLNEITLKSIEISEFIRLTS